MSAYPTHKRAINPHLTDSHKIPQHTDINTLTPLNPPKRDILKDALARFIARFEHSKRKF